MGYVTERDDKLEREREHLRRLGVPLASRGWRNWKTGQPVASVVGKMRGEVITVMALGAGNNKIRVRWENGSEGWSSPINVRAVEDTDGEA